MGGPDPRVEPPQESTVPTLRASPFFHRACYILVHTAMKDLRYLAGLVVLFPAAFSSIGCIGRTAPFDQMDGAQVVVLRLAQPQAPPALQPGALPGGLNIPGIPPQLQQMGQAALQGLQGALPGIVPQGGIPGLPGAVQPQPQMPQFKGFSIVAQMPVADGGMKDDLLDIFGHEGSFSNQAQNCFSPGLGVVFTRPNAPEVDLLVSLSCNQVKMDGARWPFAVNGLTPETRAHLGQIYEKFFGPVPPGA
jgi:hypothetical protein